MKALSPSDIAKAEVLDIIRAHIQEGTHRPRFGPESKEFTEMKRRELASILYNLEEDFGFMNLQKIKILLLQQK